MNKKLFYIFILLGACDAFAMKPLYELGVGVFHTRFPDYPGSRHNQYITFPFPSVIYRGEILRADREEGLRGRFFNSDRLEINFSGDGTFPVDSYENGTRRGMPDLDPVLEIGPSLIYKVLRYNEGIGIKINFHLAARPAFSSGGLDDIEYRGFAINPFISMNFERIFLDNDRFYFSFGGKWTSREWMDYYYSVDPQFATSVRPSYQADGGLAEISAAGVAIFALPKKINFFAGVIMGLYHWTQNNESPLHVRDTTVSTVIGLNWNFYKSSKLVAE